MGLFGALFAGVSGLDSQSNKIGVISNNISNVNTVGYKQGSADFDTLVVPSGSTTFSPGGVIGGNTQLVNQQGLISATTSGTDVAVTGNGLVVVSSTAAGVNSGGTEYYTRAGSFTQDSSGNFVNADGYYLQGLAIGSDGTAGQPNNAKLVTVSVNQSATGAASATTALTIESNLNAKQTVLPGAGITATMQAANGTSSYNVTPTGSQILIGNDVPTLVTGTNNLVKGATLNVASTSADGTTTTNDNFVYGGFTIGRNVSIKSGTAAAILPESTALNGGGMGDNTVAQNLETNRPLTINSTGTVNVTVTDGANAVDYAVGQNVSLSGITNVGGSSLTLDQLNSEWQVTANNAGVLTLTSVNVPVGAAGTYTGGAANATVSNRTVPFSGNILNATSTTADFLSTGTGTASTFTSTSDFASDATHFSISVNGNTPVTFTYSPTPNPSSGTFNNMTTLAQAISDSSGLTARADANGRLYVSSTNANDSVTFTNGDATGTASGPGIDWVQELGLVNQVGSGTSGINYFNSLNGLAAAIGKADPANLTATVTNPNAQATLNINEANPEQTISFTDATSGSSILKELGVVNPKTVTGGTDQFTTGILPTTYQANDPSKNMSSGAVTPQFTHDVTVYDAQGTSHTIALNFVKLATNTWAVEATAVPATEVNTPNNDGLLGSGIITFNGNGSLATDSLGKLTANWVGGASGSSISVDFGLDATTGDPAQVTQSSGASTMQATQNGAPTGELTGVSIDQNGFVIAAFSNGQTQKLYQVPLAVVNNPNGMESVSGDAYQETLASGEPTLNFANQGGAGEFTPSALEQSNVDLSTQLTDLIVAQQAYGANSKVLTVADSLLQELDQIIQ